MRKREKKLENKSLVVLKKTAMASAISTALTASAIPSTQAQLLEEVVVTATRRAQSVQDIPYNITALTGEDIKTARAFGLSDLARTISGISYVDQGPVARSNNNNFTLRGLNIQSANNNQSVAAQSAAAVSTYLGETPIFFPMALKDIERVEVLRGPQGTLYGASSLGGTIRFIPEVANFDGFTVDIDSSVSFTEASDDLSYTADGVVNIPIIDDVLAMRVAAGYVREGGFIDAVGRPVLDGSGVPVPNVAGDINSGLTIGPAQEDVNDADQSYVRVSLTWQPTDAIDVKVRYQHDESEQDDQQIVNPSSSPITVNASAGIVPGSTFVDSGSCGPGINTPGYYLCGAGLPFPNGASSFPAAGGNKNLTVTEEPYDADVDSVALDISIDVGFGTLTSTTSYYDINEVMISDFTGGFETTQDPGANSLLSYYLYYPRFTDASTNTNSTRGLIQEVRIVSDWDNRWDFTIGGFYQKLENDFTITDRFPGLSAWDQANFYYGFNNTNLPDIGYTLDRSLDFEDVAVFGEVTFNITEQWQITGGIRAFFQELEAGLIQTAPFCGSYCAEDGLNTLGLVSVPVSKSEVDDQIFKVNTSYDVNEDMMVYFTWAEGFRRGGANGVPLGGNFASLPHFLTYQPDEATNYEIGVKGELWGKVAYSLAGYIIDWSGFQFDTFNGAFLPLVVNGSEVETRGIELSLQGNITEQLSFNLGYGYTEAEVQEDLTISDLPLGGGAPVPQTTLFDGDQVPGVPEHSVTLGLDYEHPVNFIGNDFVMKWHVDGSFRDETQSNFNVGSGNYFIMDDFWVWNGSVSLESASWSLTAFLRNIGDEEGITGGNNEFTFGTRGQHFYVTRPRSVGIAFSYSYN